MKAAGLGVDKDQHKQRKKLHSAHAADRNDTAADENMLLY